MSRAMKDSGIKWISYIPKDWNISKIKFLSKIYTGNSISDNDKSAFTNSLNSLPYISTKDINVDTNLVNYYNDLFIPISKTEFKVAKECSTLVCIEGGSAGKKKAHLNQRVCFVNKLCCIDANESLLNKKYAYYYIMSEAFNEPFKLNISGLIGGVSTSILKQFITPLPKLLEQNEIANFLDKKTSQIDSTIALQKEAIQKYKEYKQSLITEAVTKGLDKNAKMKDSGIEYIGEIPDDWEFTSFKRFIKINNGREIKEEVEESQNAIPVYGSGGVFKFTTDFLCSEPSVLFGRKGSIGKPLYVEDKFWTVDTMYYTSFKPNIIPKYCYYMLQPFPWDLITTKTALPSVVGSDVAEIKFAFPCAKTQKEVVSYLDKKCSELDSVILEKENIITKLEEYKKSLIYEYVTGKKEVY